MRSFSNVTVLRGGRGLSSSAAWRRRDKERLSHRGSFGRRYGAVCAPLPAVLLERGTVPCSE